MNKIEIEKMYDDIIKKINSYRGYHWINLSSIESTASKHIFSKELEEDCNIIISHENIYSKDWINVKEYIRIGWFWPKYNRSISWSDDWKQPKDELLLMVSFPTWSYIFWKDYDKDLFIKFFSELRSYSPKYSDTHNKNLYFDKSNMWNIFNNFDDIFTKYKKIYREAFLKREIKRLQEEINKLK